MRKLLLLRPEPGLSASAERAKALGLEVIACPLFEIEAVGWDVPGSANYDALLLTSANAVRHAGEGLERLRSLPVHAVGEATASAASGAGLRVVNVGWAGAAELLATLPPSARLLHLAGEHLSRPDSSHRIDTRIVYRSAAIEEPALPPLKGLVAAVHSPRAGARLAELSGARHRTMIAAISPSAAEVCGGGWERVESAVRPDDESLLAVAAMLCHTSPQE
jgi:uroporphyrinogen-III synthase